MKNWQQQQERRKQKEKETKEQKKIFGEHLIGFDDIACEFHLCTFNVPHRASIREFPKIAKIAEIEIAEFLRSPVLKNICDRLLLSDVVLSRSI